MKLIHVNKKPFGKEQKEFILSSLKSSFPKYNFVFKNNKIFTKRFENLNILKQSCLKIVEVSKEKDANKIIFQQKNKVLSKKTRFLF